MENDSFGKPLAGRQNKIAGAICTVDIVHGALSLLSADIQTGHVDFHSRERLFKDKNVDFSRLSCERCYQKVLFLNICRLHTLFDPRRAARFRWRGSRFAVVSRKLLEYYNKP